jgi:SAM-dependent methyltransferase
VTAADIDKAGFQATGADFSQIDFNDPQATSSFVQKYSLHFDVVVGMEVIEHVENPWDYVRLLLSLLKPRGVLVLTTPNITSRLSRMIFFFTGRFHQFNDSDLAYGHIAPITSWSLKLIMERSGLKEIVIRPAGTLPFVWFTSALRFSLLNFFGSFFRPLMRGQKDGWCIVAMGRKP